MNAIKEAAAKIGKESLKKCTLYVTLEPCPMCAGAIINCGIKSVVFGAYDNDFGAYDGYVNLFSHFIPCLFYMILPFVARKRF
jgi:tRNA(adenine34) deaminase